MVAEGLCSALIAANRSPRGEAESRMKSGTILSMGSGLVSPVHLIFLLLLALLLFGAKRLPEIGRSLGTGMRDFKSSLTGENAPRPLAAVSQAAEMAPAPATTEAQAPVD